MSKKVGKFFLTKYGNESKIELTAKKKGDFVIKKQIESVQEWLPYEYFLENGMIQLKNKAYIKILQVSPINFNLKSELEKEAVLNSYKLFLKTCNFNFQIIIQSSKEDLKTHMQYIEKRNDSQKIKKITQNYMQYIKNLNQNKKSSSKKFYIILKKSNENQIEKIIEEELNEQYFKIKECLARCGNIVKDISTKQEAKEIIFSFLNKRIYLEKI